MSSFFSRKRDEKQQSQPPASNMQGQGENISLHAQGKPPLPPAENAPQIPTLAPKKPYAPGQTAPAINRPSAPTQQQPPRPAFQMPPTPAQTQPAPKTQAPPPMPLPKQPPLQQPTADQAANMQNFQTAPMQQATAEEKKFKVNFWQKSPKDNNTIYASAAEITKLTPAHTPQLPPAPRKLSFSLLTANLFTEPHFICGAAALVCVLLILLVQIPLTDFQSLRFSPEAVTLVKGRAIRVNKTYLPVISDFSPLKVTYSFVQQPLNRLYTSASYSLTDFDYAKGDEVSIEYLTDDPAVSRIVGLQGNILTPDWLWLTLPFFFFFCLLMTLGFRKGKLINDYLANGTLAYGAIKVFERKLINLNIKRDFKFLRYNTYSVTFSTPQGIRYADLELMANAKFPDTQHSYPVLYTQGNKKTALLLDAKSMQLATTYTGELESKGLSTYYLQLLPPLLVAAAVLLMLFIWFTVNIPSKIPLDRRYRPIYRNQHQFLQEGPPRGLRNTGPAPIYYE